MLKMSRHKWKLLPYEVELQISKRYWMVIHGKIQNILRCKFPVEANNMLLGILSNKLQNCWKRFSNI